MPGRAKNVDIPKRESSASKRPAPTAAERHKSDNPEQSKRFVDMAREVGADESPDALDRALDKLEISKATSESASVSSHRSLKKGHS
jgi:hypothetical protein